MSESIMEIMWRTGHISAGNASYVEELYERYLQEPAEVPEQWRSYFETLPLVKGANAPDISHFTIKDHFLLLAKNQSRVVPVSAASINSEHERKQFSGVEMINGYRRQGHLKAKLDPLGLQEELDVPVLTLEHHKLSAADLDTRFQTGNLLFGQSEAPLREIVDVLDNTYCGSIGAEYMHITDEAEQMWVQQRMESAQSKPAFGEGVKRRILDRLVAAEGDREGRLELRDSDCAIAVAVKVAEHVFNADAAACGVGAQPVEQLLECGRRWRGDDARAVV